MCRFVSGGLAAATLGTVLMVAGALPVSAQVARPQSALAIGDNSDLLTLVQQRGDRGGRGGGDRVGRSGGDGGGAVRMERRGGRGDNVGIRARADRGQVMRGSRDSNVRIARHRGNWNNHNRHRWSNNWRWRRNHWGSGVAVGLAFGAPYYAYDRGYYGGGDAVAYCMERFQSYNPASGTYLGYDGFRHPCP